MINYKIIDFDEAIGVKSEAKTRKEAKENLDQYLDSISTKANKYYYVEVFSKGVIGGVICIGIVDFEPEYNKKYRDYKFKAGDCVTFTVTEQEYFDASNGLNNIFKDLTKYLSDNKYKLREMPFFEVLPSDENNSLKFYCLVK